MFALAEVFTVGKVAVGSGVDGVAQGELELLVAGEIERVGWPRPHRQHVHAPDRPPHPLGPDDLPERVHHVAVVRPRLRLQALHAGLPTQKVSERKGQTLSERA